MINIYLILKTQHSFRMIDLHGSCWSADHGLSDNFTLPILDLLEVIKGPFLFKSSPIFKATLSLFYESGCVVPRSTPRRPEIPHYGSGTGSRGGGWWGLAKRPYYLGTYRTVFDVAPALGFSL